MDLWQTVLVLFRRWYIVLPAFVGSLVVTGFAYSLVPTYYESGSVLALTTPVEGGTRATTARGPSELTNPLMNFDRGLSLTGAIIIQEMNSPATAADLGITPGGLVEYRVGNGSSNPELLETGPFLFIVGKGPSAEAAEDITRRVAQRATEVLADRQRALKAPSSTHIEIQRVVPVTDARPLKGQAQRAAAAGFALALLVSLFAVYGFESFATRPRRPGPHPPSPQAPDEDRAPTTARDAGVRVKARSG